MERREHLHGSAAQTTAAFPGAQIIRLRQREEAAWAPVAGAGLPCTDCRSRNHCWPGILGDGSLRELAGLVGRRRLPAGAPLFHEGEKCGHLYAVRTGSFKATMMLRDGREQVTCFALPGDLLGVDGLGPRAHPTAATALEDSEVCSIPAATLHELALHNSNWQDTLCRLLGQEILREHRHALLLGNAGTEARLAAFLLDLSGRLHERGYSASEFHMRMSRAEIGSYVGLTLETISRTLSAFQARGILQVHKRHIVIRDRDTLQDVVQREGL